MLYNMPKYAMPHVLTGTAIIMTAELKIVPFREHSKYTVKNKRGLHGSTCGIDNYITL